MFDLTINPTTQTVRDLDLAQALGYGRPDSIRVLIKKHLPTLGEFGAVHCADALKPRGTKGATQTVTEFHLNRKQAIYLPTQAGTAIQQMQVNDVAGQKARATAQASASDAGVSGLSVDSLMADYHRQQDNYDNTIKMG